MFTVNKKSGNGPRPTQSPSMPVFIVCKFGQMGGFCAIFARPRHLRFVGRSPLSRNRLTIKDRQNWQILYQSIRSTGLLDFVIIDGSKPDAPTGPAKSEVNMR